MPPNHVFSPFPFTRYFVRSAVVCHPPGYWIRFIKNAYKTCLFFFQIFRAIRDISSLTLRFIDFPPPSLTVHFPNVRYTGVFFFSTDVIGSSEEINRYCVYDNSKKKSRQYYRVDMHSISTGIIGRNDSAMLITVITMETPSRRANRNSVRRHSSFSRQKIPSKGRLGFFFKLSTYLVHLLSFETCE